VKFVSLIALAFLGAFLCLADVSNDQPSPKSPLESLNCIHAPSGFKVEIVATEPLIESPVAFDWSADGRLWVVEMTDYPRELRIRNELANAETPGSHEKGRIVVLEDTKGKGVYDKSTVFLDGLNYPNGICAWRSGVIVSAGGEIFYAESTDGSGKTNVRKTILSGFSPGNPQHRVNGFDYGLDNWLYAANGDNGGRIRSFVGGAVTSMGGCDLRFRPDTGEFDFQAGTSQYGRHRDDWGNWFGNRNVTWLWNYFIPMQYLRRNPNLFVRDLKQDTAQYPHARLAFQISPPMPRFNEPADTNQVTAGCSPMPYRDDLFGSDYANSVFICEPAHNLIHREVLEPDGVSFKSHRAATEQTNEFLNSTDDWFRPVYLKTGPDGALYVADMYRLVIEHPDYIPRKMQNLYDLRAGHDMGRIYRIYPAGAKLRPIPHLDKLSIRKLVKAMDSPNGWQRDTVQRLLVQSQNKAAIAPLEKLARGSDRPKARLQALCTLDGLNALTPKDVLQGLDDPHPGVREQAVRLSEGFLKKPEPPPALTEQLLKMADAPEIRVRYQLAFTLGEWNDPRAGRALARLALKDGATPAMQIAIMSSARPRLQDLVETMFSEADSAHPVPAGMVEQLMGLGTTLQDRRTSEMILSELAEPKENGRFAPWQMAALAGFLDALDQRGRNFNTFYQRSRHSLKTTLTQVNGIFTQARTDVRDPAATDADRVFYVRLLGRGLDHQAEDAKLLENLLKSNPAPLVSEAVIDRLRQSQSPEVPATLLTGWPGYLPSMRQEVLTVLTSRPEWASTLLAALEKGVISPGQVGVATKERLLTFDSPPAIKGRAQKVFSPINSDRKKIVDDYASSVGRLTGDAKHGIVLFRQNCVMCHRLDGEGHEVGPDLGSVAGKSAEYLVTAILDPSQSIEPRYTRYDITTKDDRELSGIITAETPDYVTLTQPGGIVETVPRRYLEKITSSKISLMPDGFEGALSKQAMADLIAYIGNRRN
jgi:putative membrane-bound dehydrogenase-like protein